MRGIVIVVIFLSIGSAGSGAEILCGKACFQGAHPVQRGVGPPVSELTAHKEGYFFRPHAEPEGTLGLGTSWDAFPSLNEGIGVQGVTQAINVVSLLS